MDNILTAIHGFNNSTVYVISWQHDTNIYSPMFGTTIHSWNSNMNQNFPWNNIFFWTNTALILVCESIWDCAQKYGEYGGHFGNGYVLVLSSRAFGSIVPAHSHPQKQNMLRANTQLVWVWIRTQFWACFHWYHFVGSNNYPLLVGTIPMFSVYTPRSCCLCIYYISHDLWIPTYTYQ